MLPHRLEYSKYKASAAVEILLLLGFVLFKRSYTSKSNTEHSLFFIWTIKHCKSVLCLRH